MDWVKSMKGYYRLFEIATGTDAMEVMFKRGDVLAGEIGRNGLIPDAMLPQLCRKPAQAKKIAEQLVDTGLWARVQGGYLVVDWAEHNAELVKLTARKKRDRDRKRAERAAPSVDVSADRSTDSPRPRPGDSLYESESQSQRKNAAAAASAAAAGEQVPTTTPVAVDILADKLRQHTPLRALRTDKLNPDQVAQLLDLIERHGDQRLVDQALAAVRRDDPPRTIQAFLPGWLVMPAPGQRLALVTADPCPAPGHSGTTRHCAQCASEQKAAR